MASKRSTISKKVAKKPAAKPALKQIRFTTKILRPASPANATWAFLKLPKKASAKLPARGQVSVEGTINDAPFVATLDPDGEGGHWLKVDSAFRSKLKQSGAKLPGAGDEVTLVIAPVPPEREPEPKMPADLRKALAAAPPEVKEQWHDTTPLARRDFIHWIVSAKKDETRAKRILAACDMLAKGKRRPCCFDRSGMYGGGGKSMSCPVAADDE